MRALDGTTCQFRGAPLRLPGSSYMGESSTQLEVRDIHDVSVEVENYRHEFNHMRVTAYGRARCQNISGDRACGVTILGTRST
jgi:hypothetical protein